MSNVINSGVSLTPKCIENRENSVYPKCPPAPRQNFYGTGGAVFRRAEQLEHAKPTNQKAELSQTINLEDCKIQ